MLGQQHGLSCKANWAKVPGATVRYPLQCYQRKVYRTIAQAAAPPAETPAVLQSLSFSSEEEEPQPQNKAFPYKMYMDPQQEALSKIPLPLLYPGFLAAVGAAGFVGSILGRAAPVEPQQKEIVSYVTAAVAGAATVAGLKQVKEKRDSASVIELYNTIVDLPDTSYVTSDIIKEVGKKYGLDMHKEQLDGLKKIYSQFLENIIPVGDVQLKGDEAVQAKAFKEALGLSDEDAAPVHIEVGRRFYRDTAETKNRMEAFDKRKAFQRLVYISQVIYGDQKAAFLLPWRRTFNLNDSQVVVALRDNAKAIFKQVMEQLGELPADREALRELKAKAADVKLFEESAAELVKEYSRRRLERHLTKAVEVTRVAGLKDMPVLVSEVKAILSYGRQLAQLATEEDMMPGLAMPTLAGSTYMQETKQRDVRDVYKAFIEDGLQQASEFTPELEADAKDLATIFCLGAKEAQTMQDEVVAKLYKALLREEVVSGRLDAAESPAEVLSSLVERIRFNPEAALELHKSLYSQKFASLAEKRKLTDADAADLARVRRILCISKDAEKKVQKDIVGKELANVISEIFMMGAKPLSDVEGDRLDKVMKDLKIDSDVGVDILTQVTRERFRNYVQDAQKTRDRKEFVSTLKKLVQFNALVVTPVLERIKGTEAAKKELAEILKKAAEEAKKEGLEAPASETTVDVAPEAPKEDTLTSVRKAIQASRGELLDEDRKGQKDITLKNDLDEKTRAEIYKNFLLSSLQNDVVELPVGGAIRKKANESTRMADMSRLQALADILGMSQMETMQVQQGMAEQAYKAQATDVLRSGPLDAAKQQYLDQMAQQFGLMPDVKERALKAAKTEVYGTAAAAEEGKWTLERVVEMSTQGVDVAKVVDEVHRRNIYRREVQKKISDGTGDLDAAYFQTQLPQSLALPEYQVRKIVKEEVASRKRMVLVQAVSENLQGRKDNTIKYLQNLVSCTRILPEGDALMWKQKSDLLQIYAVYCTQEGSDAKRRELQGILGLTDEEAANATVEVEVASKSMQEEESWL